jgi:hypothetical protein
MPIHIGRDNETGLYFVRYGDRGKKYFFNSKSVKSFKSAFARCRAQARAIHANGYHGN